MEKKDKIIWAAGFIEGDGTIRMAKNNSFKGKQYFTPWVAVGQIRSTKTLEVLKELFGGNIYEDKGFNPLSKNRKFKWIVTGKKAINTINEIKPYLIDRQEATIVLDKVYQYLKDKQKV